MIQGRQTQERQHEARRETKPDTDNRTVEGVEVTGGDSPGHGRLLGD